VQVHHRLLERVVRHFLEPRHFGHRLQYGQLLDLVDRGQPPRAAAVPLQPLLIEAEVVDEAAAADRPAEQGFLLAVRIDPESIGFAHQHTGFVYNRSPRATSLSDDSNCTGYRRRA
jgi:hypothetical protein